MISPKITRREFLQLAGYMSAGYFLYETFGFLFSVERAKKIAITHHKIKSRNLDQKWNNTFILHFSDMHVSSRDSDFINPEVVRGLTQQVADYLVYSGALPKKTFLINSGDLVSYKTGTGKATPLDDVKESLHYLSELPFAAGFFVEGNHEIAHPHTMEIFKLVEESNLIHIGQPEQNNYCIDSSLMPFTLVGLPDFTIRENSWYGGSQASKFLHELRNRSNNKPMVIASHTSFFDVWQNELLQKCVSNTLFLHGHTHGGQLGSNTPLQYIAGQYAVFSRLKQKSKFYRGITALNNGNMISVSSGIGHTHEQGIRTAQPEVVIYELTV